MAALGVPELVHTTIRLLPRCSGEGGRWGWWRDRGGKEDTKTRTVGREGVMNEGKAGRKGGREGGEVRERNKYNKGWVDGWREGEEGI